MRIRHTTILSEPRGFTLIELLIVIAIIAILATIAVPNFLEAQVRAKVSRAMSDMRAIETGLTAFYMDNHDFPEGTDNPAFYPQEMVDTLGALAPGFYAFRTRGPNGQVVGRDFMGLTTPIAYMTDIPADPFVESHGPFTYSYRNAKTTRNGWILTSPGPDNDLLAPGGVGTTNTYNPFSTAVDGKTPARLGDINEREVIHWIEGDPTNRSAYNRSRIREHLNDLSYDPTNGTMSDGDIYRLGF